MNFKFVLIKLSILQLFISKINFIKYKKNIIFVNYNIISIKIIKTNEKINIVIVIIALKTFFSF